MQFEVHWRISHSASCCHAAEAICRQRTDVDQVIDSALRGAAERLQWEVTQAALPEDDFWDHLVPLAGEIDNDYQLSEFVLRKTLGLERYRQSQVAELARCLTQLETSAQHVMAGLADRLTSSSESLRQQWDLYGANLLKRAGLRTDERAIVGEATVDLVYPALGGAGVAHLAYNTARIEVLQCDPVSHLPEVVRLAWLLAQLNVDLPLFGETISRKRQGWIGRLAWLPIVLEAAEELGLTGDSKSLWKKAIVSWRISDRSPAPISDTLSSWWQSYQDLRPRWDVALVALDQMLSAVSL